MTCLVHLIPSKVLSTMTTTTTTTLNPSHVIPQPLASSTWSTICIDYTALNRVPLLALTIAGYGRLRLSIMLPLNTTSPKTFDLFVDEAVILEDQTLSYAISIPIADKRLK